MSQFHNSHSALYTRILCLRRTSFPFTSVGCFPRAWLAPRNTGRVNANDATGRRELRLPRKKTTSCGVSRLMLLPLESTDLRSKKLKSACYIRTFKLFYFISFGFPIELLLYGIDSLILLFSFTSYFYYHMKNSIYT